MSFFPRCPSYRAGFSLKLLIAEERYPGMLAGEFIIVNGEFPNLRCLMNTLIKESVKRELTVGFQTFMRNDL